MDEDIKIQSGMSPQDSPYPLPELAIGNVVKLKHPYPSPPLKGKRRYGWGMIVEHLGRNAWGVPKVSLHLFDGRGKMMMEKEQGMVPTYVDLVASKLIVWHLVGTIFYRVINETGWDLYPTCPKCRNRNQHPFSEKKCADCGGWGHVREMRRIPKEMLVSQNWG